MTKELEFRVIEEAVGGVALDRAINRVGTVKSSFFMLRERSGWRYGD